MIQMLRLWNGLPFIWRGERDEFSTLNLTSFIIINFTSYDLKVKTGEMAYH